MAKKRKGGWLSIPKVHSKFNEPDLESTLIDKASNLHKYIIMLKF